MAKKGSKQRQHYRKSKKGKIFRAGSIKYYSSKPFTKIPKQYEHLQMETAVYVPNTIYHKETDKYEEISNKEYNERIKETRTDLSNFFGGYTSVEAIGGWIDDQKKLIEDDIVKVTSFSTKKRYLKNRDKLQKWIENKVNKWKQRAISFEFEGDLYFVKTED